MQKTSSGGWFRKITAFLTSPQQQPSPHQQSSSEQEYTDTVAFVWAKCGNKENNTFGKPFRMRFEEKKSGEWVLTDAYEVDQLPEEGVQASQDDETVSMNKRTNGKKYKGCPYCGLKSHVPCCSQHGKVFCWDGKKQVVICPWCKHQYGPGGGHRDVTAKKQEQARALPIEHTENRSLMIPS